MICSTQLRWLHFWHRSFYLITAFASPTASAEGRINRAGRTDTVAAAASNMLSAAALPLSSRDGLTKDYRIKNDDDVSVVLLNTNETDGQRVVPFLGMADRTNNAALSEQLQPARSVKLPPAGSVTPKQVVTAMSTPNTLTLNF